MPDRSPSIRQVVRFLKDEIDFCDSAPEEVLTCAPLREHYQLAKQMYAAAIEYLEQLDPHAAKRV